MNLLRMNALLIANRESPHGFSMSSWQTQGDDLCGTRACLMGNYALREDLQSSFVMREDLSASIYEQEYKVCSVDSSEMGPMFCVNGRVFSGPWPAMVKHFDITPEEAVELFSYDGCDWAETDRDKAIAYVEAFITRKLAERTLSEEEPEEEEIAA